jgi:DNA-binding CsgD family transcriptional regulator
MGVIELVQLVSDGYSIREISESSGVNVRTLEATMQRARDKSFATSAAHLVAIYLRKGLIK